MLLEYQEDTDYIAFIFKVINNKKRTISFFTLYLGKSIKKNPKPTLTLINIYINYPHNNNFILIIRYQRSNNYNTPELKYLQMT